MFPDAPTVRGRRHVEELADLQKSGEYECHVLLVLHHRDTRCFIPNFHTDPDFSITLRDRAPDLHIHAVSVSTDAEGKVSLVNPDLPVDFTPVAASEEDRGFYLLIFELTAETDVPQTADTGAADSEAGTVRRFSPGWYIAVVDAPRALRASLNRDLRKKKAVLRPLDRLTVRAGVLKGAAVYSGKNLAGEFAGDLAILGKKVAAGSWRTGKAEDSSRDSSPQILLFSWPRPPVFDEAFTRLLFHYRHGKALDR